MQLATVRDPNEEIIFYNLVIIQYGLRAELPELNSLPQNKLLEAAVNIYPHLNDALLKRYIELIFKYLALRELCELFLNCPISLFVNASMEYLWYHVRCRNDLGLALAFAIGYQKALNTDFFSGMHVSPLHLAARDTFPMLVDLYLQMGLHFGAIDTKGKTVADYALKNIPVLEYLESNGILTKIRQNRLNFPSERIKTLLPRQPRQLTVVFDLDGTLVLEIKPNEDFCNIFIKKRLTIYAGGLNYIILPGALELIRMMADKPNVEIVIYTHGVAARNDLVLKLFQMSLGDLRGKAAFARCRIFSRNDCIPHLKIIENNRPNFGVHGQNYTKNLLQVRNSLEDIIIVEDRRESASPNQEANLLFLRLCAKNEKYLQAFRNIRKQHKNKGRSNPRDFFYVNQLFYAAAIIGRTFVKMDLENINFREALVSVQYKENNGKFELRKELSKDKAVYTEGKKLLRQANSRLCFFSKHNYRKFFHLEKQFIKANQPAPSLVTPVLVRAAC